MKRLYIFSSKDSETNFRRDIFGLSNFKAVKKRDIITNLLLRVHKAPTVEANSKTIKIADINNKL